MITEYSKRNSLGFAALTAFGLVLLFTAGMFADDTAAASPAKPAVSIKVSTAATTPAKTAKPADPNSSATAAPANVNTTSTKGVPTVTKTADTASKTAEKPKKTEDTSIKIVNAATPKEQNWKFEWFNDLNKGLEVAKKRNLPVMLVFSGSDWCVWCKKLDAEVFQKKEFQDYARNKFVSVLLDTPRAMMQSRPHGAVMAKYGVTGFPGVVFIDHAGQLILKTGYRKGGPGPYISFLAEKFGQAPQKAAAPASTKPLKFDRSPAAILKVLQKQMELRDKNEKISDEDQFTMDVTLGNWKAVEAYLATLSESDAKKTYAQLLTELKATRYVRTTASSKKMLKSIFTLEDFFTISDFCPGELDSTQIKAMAEILNVILGSGDYRQAMLDTLEKGTARFGGTDRQKRMAAARLLFEMNMKLEAGKFLPAPQTAMDENDMTTVKMLINHLAQKAQVEKDASAMDQAWQLAQWILLDETSSPAERQEAFTLTLSLIPTLDKKVAAKWLSERFIDDPLLGMKILVTVGDSVLKNTASSDVKTRTNNMVQLSRTVGSLLEIIEGDSWDSTLNALTWCWVREAEITVGNYQKPQRNTRYMSSASRAAAAKKVAPYIPVNDILTASPDDRWLARIDSDTKNSVLMLKARLLMKIERMSDAMDIIKQVSASNPTLCTSILNNYIRVWGQVSNHTPVELDEWTQRMIRYGRYQGMQGIPLTRSRQVRNLKNLAELFKLIPTLTNEPVDAEVAVSVFSDCHSAAEVYLKEDIEAVFGPVENISPDISIRLISVMRTRLTGIWQNAETQTNAKTNRSETQMFTQVHEGYELLEQLIQSSNAAKDDNNWQYHRLKAMAMYDSAEFYYSLKDKDLEEGFKKYSLAEYTKRRDAALESFKRSAQCYSAIAPEMSKSDRSVLVYLHWFYVTLGASDLAHLKRSADYSRDYLADIRQEIMKMPPALADEHLKAFGDSIKRAISQVGPDLKMRLLTASLVITGDHPASQYARKVLDYYNELLGEVKLKVRIDSDRPGSVVGSNRPFGLFIELDHTRNIERESGGFGKYLQNAGTGYYSQNQVDHRDVFRNYITDALLKSFNIESLVFSKPSVKSIASPASENGYITPLAYCLMTVKDKSVDSIPPVQMDMDFVDLQGKVVLPLLSNILPIDAKSEPEFAPVSGMVITQVLDDRSIEKGKLKLQIDIRANGIIPAFEDLFDMSNPDITIEGQVADFDRGLVVDELDTAAVKVAPKCQRSWDINFKISLDKDIDFKFPALKKAFADAKIENKRYKDADIVQAASIVPIRMNKVSYTKFLYSLIAVIPLALIAWFVSTRKKPAAVIAQGHKLPENITPFTLLSFMKHIESDDSVTLSQQELELFKIDVDSIEKAYFSPNDNGDKVDAPDVEKLARKYRNLVCDS